MRELGDINNNVERVKGVLNKVQITLVNLDMVKNEVSQILDTLEEEARQAKKEHRKLIVEAMQEKGYTKEKLAQLLGLTVKMVENMLEGKIDLGIKSLIKICMELDIPYDDIKK